jgi:hypothetical protein
MNSLKIIGYTTDFRSNTKILYAQIKLNEYLDLVGEDFDRFEIQRKKEKHKGYSRLKKDIEKGTLVPTITLAVEPSSVADFEQIISSKNDKLIIEELIKITDKIYILDGLQRTYIINELKKEGVVFNNEQELLLEIWFEKDIKNLIYRLIVLNSGQKPMSMRHQIELLFITMRETIINDISGLEVLEEKDESKRTKPKQFPFERLVTAYKSYLTKSPEADKDNIVAERMKEAEMLESDEQFLSEPFIKFKSYLEIYCQLDEQVFRIYNESQNSKYRNWLAEPNVIQAFFSSLSKFSSTEDREKTALDSIEKLIESIKSSTQGDDVLNIKDLNEILSNEAVTKKYNVGFATRKLLSSGFTEYFKNEGYQSLKECWLISSAEL